MVKKLPCGPEVRGLIPLRVLIGSGWARKAARASSRTLRVTCVQPAGRLSETGMGASPLMSG